MAGLSGFVKDVVKEGAEAATKEAVKVGAKGAGAVTNVQKKLYEGAFNRAGEKILAGSDGIVNRAINKNFGETVNNLTARAERLGKMAETGVIERAAKQTASEAGENIAENAGKEIGKKVSGGIGKNALIGGAVGSITGAGIGGVTGMATGADEDDMKSMVLLGALAGGTAGAIGGAGSKMIRNKSATGSMFEQGAKKAAKEMCEQGGKNMPVGGGANGLFDSIKNGGSNLMDKIDDFGNTIQHNYTGKKGREISQTIAEMQKAGDFDVIDKQSFIEGITGNADMIRRKGATLGGAAQGALVGSAGGALIGGVAGGIDEDESFLGGALKGGFIGGTLGGIGGGASGYFNNSAKVLSNTVENIGSLFA
jgi:hypothetical protein